MSEEIAIRIDHVSKDFVLPHERTQSIKTAFVKSLRGKKSKTKEKQHALRDITLDIKKGEFFGIVGRNGSGKSTLLKIISQIYQPTKGSVTVNGRLVPFIELGVGFNSELTGRDNVYQSASLLGFSKTEIDGMYDDIVEFAELKRFMDQKLKNYSSGMQVRLAFSIATRVKSDILIVDEVLAVGDEDFQRKCFDYFRKLKKEHTTVVFVSHNMGSVREFCDRVALIEDNKLVSVGDPSSVSEMYSSLFVKDVNLEGKFTALNIKRRGNGSVIVKDIEFKKRVLTKKDDWLEFDVRLEAQADNEDLMTGFAIKNASGQQINGTNTWNESKKLPNLEPQQECTITWRCPNIYEDGLYTLDAFVYGKDSQLYDMITEALTFQIKKTKTGFLTSPKTELTLETKRNRRNAG